MVATRALQISLLMLTLSTIACNNLSLLCQETQFPTHCLSFMSKQAKEVITAPDSRGLAAAMVKDLVNNTRSSMDLSKWILSNTSTAHSYSKDLNAVLSSCGDMLEDSLYRIQMSQHLDFQDPSSLEDAQHFISAALTYHTDCIDDLFQVSAPLLQTAQTLADKLQQEAVPLLSNTLYFLGRTWSSTYKYSSVNNTKMIEGISMPYLVRPNWMTERDLYLANAPVEDLRPSAIVSKSSLRFQNSRVSVFYTIQDAVDSAPLNGRARYIIYIPEGVYEEEVNVHRDITMLMFVGDGANQTILKHNKSVAASQVSTYHTATLGINGDHFLARDIGVENTAEQDKGQAVAARVRADKSAFYRCSFRGHQDTLYAHSLRQFYKDSIIQGTIDFIFGNSATIFQHCDIRVIPGRSNSGTSTLTAQGRSDSNQATGLVFQGCSVSADGEFLEGYESDPARHRVFLGRPWKLFARVVFADTYMAPIVDKRGWSSWDASENDTSVFFAEYNSYGPGAAQIKDRISWSFQLNSTQIAAFSVPDFIDGCQWLMVVCPFRRLGD